MGIYQEIGIGLDALVLNIQQWINDRTAPAPQPQPKQTEIQSTSKGLGDNSDWL